ncbi:MAG: murein biosynthesis integral membrane protein MurJ [Thermoanaerobaculia bacterium]|nr:murein biosynthesis integral membrane protein MurJ [Thermoanaerobaculia bacterium]
MTSIAEESKPAPKRNFGGYAMFVAAGILLSRLAGLVRLRVFAHYLGATPAADAFNVAMRVPNFLQNLFGEGVLSASFIPVYARLVSKGDEKLAGRVAGVFVSFIALGVSIIVLIGVLVTPVILAITAPGLEPPVMGLAIKLTRIIFPGVGLLVLYAWSLGILNTHRQFFLSYVAPVLWNASMIATLIIFGSRLRTAELAVALAWGTFIGCALQFGIQVPFVLRYEKNLSFGLDRTLEPVREMFRSLGPVFAGRGVVQISGYVDTFIASFLPSGAFTNIVFAQTIYMLPISLFGMSVAAAELPQMAGQTGTDEEIHTAIRKRIQRGLRQVAFFVVPTTVAFILLGRILVAALFQTGKFGAHTTLIVWYILIGSTIGLLVATMGRLYSSAFYALRDTRTPFRFAVARVIVGASLGFLLAFPFRHAFGAILVALGLPVPAGDIGLLGAVGITAASGIAAWVEYLFLRRALQRRIGTLESMTGFYVGLWASAIAAGVLALVCDRMFLHDVAQRLFLPHVMEAIAASGIFGIIYFTGAILLGVPEARATLSRLKR